MIKITIIKHADEYRGFVIRGHAGYAEEGYDIICSAVSALSVTTVNAIESLAHVYVEAEQGDGYISCQFPKGINSEGILLMDAMILGMQQIRESYGKKYTQLRFEEV